MKLFLPVLLALACCACNSPAVPAIVLPPVAVVIGEPIPIADMGKALEASGEPLEIISGTVAKANEFPAVGRLDGGGLCTATLVKPSWALTAAHCVNGVKDTGATFTVGGKKYQSDLIVRHPTFKMAAFSLGWDVALVHLKEPVVGITPAELSSTPPAVKQAITIVGFGLTGTGATGQTNGAGTKRYGEQVIDFIVQGDGVKSQTQILWMYDKGEIASIAQGDSGGPAFAKGTNTIVGIASGISAGAGGKYGVWGSYAFEPRIDLLRPWLVNTMATLK